MDTMKRNNILLSRLTIFRQLRLMLISVGLVLLFFVRANAAQDSFSKPILSEVPVQILSAEIRRFEKPVRIGVGKRVMEYREALVLKIMVDREIFDSLPPGIEPFLYIGRNEYRMFHIYRTDKGKEVILTFHIRKWEQLEDGIPVVLTIDHGAPIRDPEKFTKREGPRFNKKMIVDKR